MSTAKKGEDSTMQSLAVDHVSVRLPPFWPEDQKVWFVDAEAQLFEISGIKDDTTKFYHIISQLDQRFIKERSKRHSEESAM